SLIETQRALSDATDRLAQNKAKSLVADSYKRLIHDLYTPIAALRETIKDVDHTQLDSSALEKSASKISRLAEQILNQVSAGKENLSVEPSIFTEEDIRSCVLEASEQALLAFKNRDQVSFTGKLPDLPIVVPHDPEILRRAITNLVSNALRACKSVVEVELLVKENSVSVKVSDDGSGIEQSDVGLLLQGRTTSPGSSRPGFGLPSANHIARLHGGRIVYSKSPLGGACFEIRI
ncbi:MAG: sensor histidine kinase, partial [Bdellovibrionales bacterium]